MKSNSIDRVVVSNTNPHNNNVLWIDTSNGEKNAVLKYKGNPLSGGGSGSGSGGSDYQSSGSIVKDMVEQGSNFNWGKYAIDIPSLPCFKPEAEWPDLNGVEDVPITDVLADGYQVIRSIVVRVTGENPSVTNGSSGIVFTDCEPVPLEVLPEVFETSRLIPVRVILGDSDGVYAISEIFGLPTESTYWGPIRLIVDGGNYIVAVGYNSQGIG